MNPAGDSITDLAAVCQAVANQDHILSQHSHVLQGMTEAIRELAIKVSGVQTQPVSPANPDPVGLAPPPAVPSAPAKEPWVPPPDKYDGDFGLCRSFIMQCEIVFDQQPLSYSTDRAKVAYIMSLLRGSALSWAAAVWEMRASTSSSSSYANFITAFRQVFDHPVQGKNASNRLLSLRQGSRSVAEYSVEFRTLSAESGWNSEALQASFANGLSESIKDELVSYPESRQLEELITLALRIDNRLRERQREKTRRLPDIHAPRCTPPWPDTTRRARPTGAEALRTLPRREPSPSEPMQLGRFRLDPEERQRRISSNSCLYCGQPGHFLASCPHRPSN